MTMTMTTTVDDLVIRIDGSRFPSTDSIAEVTALCDRAEDLDGGGRVVVHASGAPVESWTRGVTVSLVSRWERALRRLERLPSVTVSIADGDCGGAALDALMATDYRIATPSLRLTLPAHAGPTWPGMVLYRLARQGANAPVVRRAVLFGHPITARDALAAHLIDEVSDDADHSLTALSALTAGRSGSELAIRRQLMDEAATTTFEDALGVHLAACDRELRRTSTTGTS
jgi:isomerase DpgB